MGKSTISMAIFHCYVSSPEGIYPHLLAKSSHESQVVSGHAAPLTLEATGQLVVGFCTCQLGRNRREVFSHGLTSIIKQVHPRKLMKLDEHRRKMMYILNIEDFFN